jgi:hypothetical protein
MKSGMWLCEGNHVRRGIYADDRALRNTGRDLSGCLSVPTADVKNLFGALEVEQGKDLIGHGRLQRRDPSVLRCVPFRHTPAFLIRREEKGNAAVL